MTHTILVLQNDPISPLGVMEPVLRDRGFAIETAWPMAAPETAPEGPEGYAGIVVLGGVMSALDDALYPGIGRTLHLLRRAHDDGVPVLGICLGGQLLARAHGAAVYRNLGGETGLTKIALTSSGEADPLLGGGTAPVEMEPVVMEMHSDRFDLPADAVHLAASSGCAQQAFRVGETSWGFQFHPEVTPAIVGGWISYLRDSAESLNRIHAENLGRALENGLGPSMEIGERIARNWCDIVARRLHISKT